MVALDPFLCARQYLAPGAGAFWRWSADRSALEWADGLTIGFAAELLAIVDHVIALGTGLPPFDAIVAIVALGREDSASRLQALAPERRGTSLGPLLGLLARMHGRPAERQVLVELALAAAERTGVRFAVAVREALAYGLPAELLAPRPEHAPALHGLLDMVGAGLACVSADRIEWRLQTGLDAPVEAADVELPMRQRIQTLLDLLDEDPEHEGLARVARQLMAAIFVPRAVSDPEDRPLGGVGGITNRGPLDRLLISELAHDADVLALRVALREAVYVEREVPPAEPAVRRYVLCEAGIRMWGRARVFAVAVALGLCGIGDPRTAVQVFGAAGARLVPHDPGHRAGLLRLLAMQELAPDPRAALPALFAACAEQPGVAEAIVVTHRDAAADPAFRGACSPPPGVRLFVATVDDRGGFALWSVTERGCKRISEAVLDLDRIAVVPSRAALSWVLPRFYAMDPRPLVLPRGEYLRSVEGVRVDSRGLAVVTRRQRTFALETRDVHLFFAAVPMAPAMAREFLPLRSSGFVGPGRTLRVAEHEGGRIVFDREGLLHLVPLLPDMPETTLVLSHGRSIAGWRSDGVTFGNRRFLPGGPSDRPGRDLLAFLRQFAEVIP
jgi:hypothetical protein